MGAKKKPQYHEYIYTYSGEAIHPEDFRPEQVHLADIAFGLSGIMRFNAQTRLSVLRHSLALASYFTDPKKKLFALLHDAAEAYCLDIPVPLKRYMHHSWHDTYDHIERVILEKFGAIHYEEVMDKDKELIPYEMNCQPRVIKGSKLLHPSNSDPIDAATHERYRWAFTDDELAREWTGQVVVLSRTS